MPQPPEVAEAAARLAAVYRAAQDRLEAELASIVNEPSRARRAARIRELIGTLAATQAGLEEATTAWLAGRDGTAGDLASIHALGATRAATDIGSSFAWTAPHQEAVQALAGRTWTDVAEHLQGMEAATTRALRGMVAETAETIILEGRTAVAAGRGLAEWMGQHGIGTVTYRNGARHLAADYADTLTRTVTALAYNEGTFTQLAGDGVEWVEVFDGPDCGWSSHNDGDKANGTIRSLEDATQHSISHPRCARSFAGRPDVTDPAGAEAARRYTPEEQARLADEERERAANAPRTLAGRARQPRVARQARVARAPRAPAGEPAAPSPGISPPSTPPTTPNDVGPPATSSPSPKVLARRVPFDVVVESGRIAPVEDPDRYFSPAEALAAEMLRSFGLDVHSVLEDSSARSSADAAIPSLGLLVEIKTPTVSSFPAFQALVQKARSQAGHIVVDVRGTGMDRATALSHVRRSVGSFGPDIDELLVIGADFTVRWPA